MRFTLLLVSATMLTGMFAVGCQGPAAKEDAVAVSQCADDGPVFPGTTTCVSRSVNFMDQDALAVLPEARDGCDWAPQETRISDTQALLYMAATCNGVASTLGYDNGKLSYASGDMYVAGQPPIIEVFETAEDDALSPLRAMIAALPADQQAGCVIQAHDANNTPGAAPAGAVVIGPTALARSQAPTDQPNSFCGAYGLNDDETSYWLLRGDKALYFSMGQEIQDIAPGTVTLMQADANGDWASVGPARGQLADCLLEVDGVAYLDGVCEMDGQADGSFQVFGKDYFAYASVLDDGMFNVSWNESPEASHAQALLGEDFVSEGNCVVGARGKVCRWELGSRR